MRKILLIPFAVCVVALLSTLSMPTVHAARPIPVSGTFNCEYEITDELWAGGNWIFEATEWETWVGDFQGESISTFTDVWIDWPDGPLVASLIGTFAGTVRGQYGTMVFRLVGWKFPTAAEDFDGRWEILSGTGDLKNLHGHGTFWGPGALGPEPHIYYSGSIIFDAHAN